MTPLTDAELDLALAFALALAEDQPETARAFAREVLERAYFRPGGDAVPPLFDLAEYPDDLDGDDAEEGP